MNVYVDASVLLRVVLGQPGSLSEWEQIDQPVSSVLIRLECLSSIDRERLLGLDESIVAERRAEALDAISRFGLISINVAVLDRAADPFPTSLGSLDAIHLATAILARRLIPDLAMATHDEELAIAARSVGFEVLGI